MPNCPSCHHELQNVPEDVRDWFRCESRGVPLQLSSALTKTLYWSSLVAVLVVGVIPLIFSMALFEGMDSQFYMLGGCILVVYGWLARFFWKTKLSRPRLYDPYSSLNLSDNRKKLRGRTF